MKTNRDFEIRIWYSPEPGDECFIAQVVELPGIMAHGNTREEAALHIEQALELALTVDATDGASLIPHAVSEAASSIAAALGRKGGSVTTPKKSKASKANGKLGGRPRKTSTAYSSRTTPSRK